jgi:hypothetical protein
MDRLNGLGKHGLEQIFCSISGGTNGGSAELKGGVIVYLYVTQALGVDIVVR